MISNTKRISLTIAACVAPWNISYSSLDATAWQWKWSQTCYICSALDHPESHQIYGPWPKLLSWLGGQHYIFRTINAYTPCYRWLSWCFRSPYFKHPLIRLTFNGKKNRMHFLHNIDGILANGLYLVNWISRITMEYLSHDGIYWLTQWDLRFHRDMGII